MTLSGWVVMVLSVGFVTGLTAWCIWRVLRAPEVPEHLHAQPEIDTHDEE